MPNNPCEPGNPNAPVAVYAEAELRYTYTPLVTPTAIAGSVVAKFHGEEKRVQQQAATFADLMQNAGWGPGD